jgi:hypothetical protein
MEASQGRISAEKACEHGALIRGDDYLGAVGAIGEIKDALARLRSSQSRWHHVYNMLALDAPHVWPPPDSRRGLRGDLKDLYAEISLLLKRD